jgi:hypothetical protein
MARDLVPPNVADNMPRISFIVRDVKQMLDMCVNYSKLWQYSYNADKCAILSHLK